MKIAIIRKKYNPYGGAERYLHGLILHLTRMGQEIHIYTNGWPVTGGEGVYFHKVPMIGGLSLLKIWSFALATWFMIRREHFDVVFSIERTFVQDIYRAADGCHKAWLTIRMEHLSPWRKLSILLNPLHWSVKFFDWFIFTRKRFKRVIALSNQSKKEIIRIYNVPPELIHVVYNGVDLDHFHPRNKLERDLIRQKLAVARDETILLYVGTGFERKGLRYLIEAMGFLKDKSVRLWIIGRGKTSVYRRIAARAGVLDRIDFLGKIDGVSKYYGAADIFVFPTLYEPFGNVHLEALASGLPVITSSVSGGSEIITPGVNGQIIADPTNPREVADKIREVIKRMIEVDMGYEARKKAEEFTLERTVRELTRIFNEVKNL